MEGKEGSFNHEIHKVYCVNVLFHLFVCLVYFVVMDVLFYFIIRNSLFIIRYFHVSRLETGEFMGFAPLTLCFYASSLVEISRLWTRGAVAPGKQK